MKKFRIKALLRYISMIISTVVLAANLSGYELPDIFYILKDIFEIIKTARPND